MNTNPFEKYVGKIIKIFQKDGFIKSGSCTGYNEQFIFLQFNDGTELSINLGNINEIRILEESK